MGLFLLLFLAETPPPAEPPAPPPAEAPADEEDDESHRPVDVPEPGTNDRLVKDIAETTGDIGLAELLDEILADVVAEIAQRPAKWVSPIAIRNIELGANVKPSFAARLEASIIANLHAGTDVRVVDCRACRATRTEIVGKTWVVTRGLVDAEAARKVAESLGVKSFLDVTFGFDPESTIVQLDFRLVRASDQVVLWADSFRADETTPLLMRSSDAPMKRKDRLKDLEMLLEGRPMYGFAASAGFLLLPYDDPVAGDIGGATFGYRLYERFGEDRRIMFGLELMGFLNVERLAGGILTAGAWWVPIQPDLIHPELRVGGKAGALIVGSEGNAGIFQIGAEVLLRYRFGLYGYVLFLPEVPFNGNNLGGVGFSTGLSFNW